MYTMLVFFIISVFGIVGYMGFISLLWAAMQGGAAFDKISGGAWSRKMDALYAKDSVWEKIFGGCAKCGSFWLFWLYAPIYAGVLVAFGADNGIPLFGAICWVMIYWFICSLAGLWAITYKTAKE